jgi:hypothetical protein
LASALAAGPKLHRPVALSLDVSDPNQKPKAISDPTLLSENLKMLGQ